MPIDEGNPNLQQNECIPHRSFCNLSLMIKKALLLPLTTVELVRH